MAISEYNVIVDMHINSVTAKASGVNFSAFIYTSKITIGSTIYKLEDYSELYPNPIYLTFRVYTLNGAFHGEIIVYYLGNNKNRLLHQTINGDIAIENNALHLEGYALYIINTHDYSYIFVSDTGDFGGFHPLHTHTPGNQDFSTTYVMPNPAIQDSGQPLIAYVYADDGYTFINGKVQVTTHSHAYTFPDECIVIQDNGLTAQFTNVIHVFEDDGVTPLDVIIPPFQYTLDFIGFTQQIVTFNITNQLHDATSDNPSVSIEFYESYTAHITPNTNRYISEVIVTMGGVNITASAYNNGTIYIEHVTGELVIQVNTHLNPSVTSTLVGCTMNPNPSYVNYKSALSSTITASSGYTLENADVLVTMGGVEQFDAYSNGAISIPEVTDDVVIQITAKTLKTFQIKSSDGNTTFLSVTLPSLTSIKIELNQNTRTITLNGTQYSYVSLIPNEYELYGLALQSNSSTWLIPLNEEIILNYQESVTFYEVMLQDSPVVSTFSLNIYKNTAESERVMKTNYLTSLGSISGTLRDGCSIIAPQIMIEVSSLIEFNYVYIGIWKRYYFVTDITYIQHGLALVSLRVDVLMSHRLKIINQIGLVSRNEHEFNEEIIDSERIVENNNVIDVVEDSSSSTKFTGSSNGSAVLNVIGGNE